MVKRLFAVIVLAGAVAGSAAAAKTPLVGIYGTAIKGLPVPLLDAAWDIQFKTDGHYVIYRNGKVVVKGYSLVQKKVVGFADESGSAACPGASSNGYYAWAFAKHAGHSYLVLKPLQDPCSGRKTVLSTHALLKVK